MRTVLVMIRSNPEEWARLLRAALPDHRIIVDAEEADGPIAYAVVGKPPPGTIAALGNLEAVFSINAGVEALLGPGGVPDEVKLVRMVDHGLTAGMLEWVTAQVLAWHRNLFAYRDSQNEKRWAPMRERLASQRKVAVLGAGALGRPVGEMLARFGFKVHAWSRSARPIEGVTCLSGAGGLRQAATGADMLVNLLPLTPDTENILDAGLLRLLAPQAVLINAARGRHLVEDDLLALLDSGHLRAAVLDVFREEPLPAGHAFWRHPGVFLSPHVAAPTDAAIAIEAIAENILAYESGAALRHVVDRARGY